jgi:hypothetical protein
MMATESVPGEKGVEYIRRGSGRLCELASS